MIQIEKERRKHKRAKAPKTQLVAETVFGNLFGRIHDIDPDGLCATLDATPEGNPINITVRMFQKDLRFQTNIIRSKRDGEKVYVAMLFDWGRTPVESQYYLNKYLAQQ